MQFDKIKYDGANVELEWREPLAGGGERDVSDTGKDPTPAFKAALQAFASYVTWIHSWPESILERLEVRGVTIKRPDGEPRGIVVTSLLKCPRARKSTSTVNTPYLAEPAETYSGDRTGFLPETTVALIDDLEARANEYQAGERGEQTALPLGDSENANAFAERAASASAKSTRNPKKGAKKAALAAQTETGVPVVNPNAGVPVTDEALRQLLLSVERDVPIDAIQRRTSSERQSAQAWAEAQQKRLIGQMKENEMPAEPLWLQRDATPALVGTAEHA